MIVHVAQAGEASGRVVLQLCPTRRGDLALEAAIRVAQAFQSEVESIFVEDIDLIELARFPFAREIPFSGRGARAIGSADVEQDMQYVLAQSQRRLTALARAAEVPLRHRVVRADPIAALASACAETGPWNVVALSDPLGTGATRSLRALFDAVSGATGLVLTGPRARRITGPVVVAAENAEHLPGLLKAAARLAPVAGSDTLLLLVAGDAEQMYWLESQARLLLSEQPELTIAEAHVTHGSAAVAAEALRRLGPGFVIAEFGGLVVPDADDLRPLMVALECPLFLVR